MQSEALYSNIRRYQASMGEISRIPSNQICADSNKNIFPAAVEVLSVTRKMPLNQDVDGSPSYSVSLS